VMCLRVLAASANCLKTKLAYGGAEAMLTYFKAAGLHRDPSLLDGRCSPFDGEMRRRLWATACSLELQASIDRGAPSALSGFPVDCRPPLNVDDDDLTLDMARLPMPKPSIQYSSAAFLHIASMSLPLRIELCALANDPSSQLRHEEVLRYEQQILDALDQIPSWTDPHSKQATALLELQLRQFLIIIHAPFARYSGSSSSRYSRMLRSIEGYP